MKKIYSVVCIIALLTSPIFSFGQKSNTSWILTEFGVNNSWIFNQNMYGNPELPYLATIGYSGEVSYKHFLNKNGYSVGLGIANLGQKYEGEMSGANAQRKVNLTYLQLPLMGIYNLGGKRQQTWLSVGPQFLFLMAARQDFNRTGEKLIPNTELMSQGVVNVKGRYKPVDIMLAFGLTNYFPIKIYNVKPYQVSEKIIWSLSLDGAIGLTDINQKQYQINNMHNKYSGSHNFYVGIRVGFMLNMKGMHDAFLNMTHPSEF